MRTGTEVASWPWWIGPRVLLAGAMVQVFGAGLFVFAGNTDFHPVFGYVLILGALIQAIVAVRAGVRKDLLGPALVVFGTAVAAPVVLFTGGAVGVPLAATVFAAHPVLGVTVVLAQYELTRRTRRP